jgi:hypothetical protein
LGSGGRKLVDAREEDEPFRGHGGGSSPIERPNSSTQREAQFGEELEIPANDSGASFAASSWQLGTRELKAAGVGSSQVARPKKSE